MQSPVPEPGTAAGGEEQQRALTVFAPAKVNLSLHVLGRRADGYHLLDSLVAFADIGDRIEVKPSETLSLTIDGPFAPTLADTDNNIILQAARALGPSESADIGLIKHLPVASGIGGGSSDAAATLHALDWLWGKVLGADNLAEIGLTLGADVPVCLRREPMRMAGVGETLSPVALPSGIGILLVNPGVGVSTGMVFKTLAARSIVQSTTHSTTQSTLPDRESDLRDRATFIEVLRGWPNDLEPPAKTLCPEITQVLEQLDRLEGRLIARMSGSGATCFALFPTVASAEVAARQLRQDCEREMRGTIGKWWIQAGRLLSEPLPVFSEGAD